MRELTGMLKKLFAKLFTNSNSNTSTNSVSNTNSESYVPYDDYIPYDDEIHEKIRQEALKLLVNAGYSGVSIDVGPLTGCDHLQCDVHGDIHWPNVPIDSVEEMQETFIKCAQNVFLIVFNEVLGPSKLVEGSTKITTYVNDVIIDRNKNYRSEN